MFIVSSKIVVATSEGKFFFHPEEIVRLEASSNYTNIYFTNKKKILSSTVLKKYATLLEPMGFVRTHRTHLVNPQHIMCITPRGNVIMKDASTAEISRRKKSGIMKALHAA